MKLKDDRLMKKFNRVVGFVAAGMVLETSCLVDAKGAGQAPNIIIIFADDMGYADLSCYGAEGYETPVLDQMAREGMRLTDFSTSSSVCSPSRAGLLTGRNAYRWGNDGIYHPRRNDGMPQSEVTIAEVLKEQGYATALVGKWHLGNDAPYLPIKQGFDSFYGIPYSNDMWQDFEQALAEDVLFNEGMTREDFYDRDNAERKYHAKVPLMQGTEVIEWPVEQSTLTRRYTEKSQAFIRANKEKPFFLYLAHAMPHVPLYASEKFKGTTERGLYGDVIEELDWSVGEILKTLRETGLDKNTLVIFTSDNGAALGEKEDGGSNKPFKSGKFSSYEGGSRVPCIAWLPGTVAAGKVCDVQTSTLDLLPTIAGMTGGKCPDDRIIDGHDIRGVLKGDFENVQVCDWFLYRRSAIRAGDWKYLNRKNRGELYNLADDPAESKNLIKQYPEKAEQMAKLLADVMAEIVPNN